MGLAFRHAALEQERTELQDALAEAGQKLLEMGVRG